MRRLIAAAREREEEQEINVTPMLDVVFIMLIFFIVTASFVKEAGVDIARPDALTQRAKPQAAILVAVTPTNEVWINQESVDVADVRPRIEKLRAENPQGSVVVQADKTSNMKTLLKVMDAARDAGVADVAISTEPQ